MQERRRRQNVPDIGRDRWRDKRRVVTTGGADDGAGDCRVPTRAMTGGFCIPAVAGLSVSDRARPGAHEPRKRRGRHGHEHGERAKTKTH